MKRVVLGVESRSGRSRTPNCKLRSADPTDCMVALVAAAPPEPRPFDPIVSDAQTLKARLGTAALSLTPISLRLVGRILLGELNVDDEGTLLAITTPVTLWSNESAVLDAGHVARPFDVKYQRAWSGAIFSIGHLRLEGVHVTGGRTGSDVPSGNVFGGGCGWVQDLGKLVVRASHFYDCKTSSAGGGGILVSGGGDAEIYNSTFTDCEVNHALVDLGAGGGVCVEGGRTKIVGTRFERTRVSCGGLAFGGGVGIWNFGEVELEACQFNLTSVFSWGSMTANRAFGGGVGVHNGASASIASSSWTGCSVSAMPLNGGTSGAFGGGLGLQAGGSAIVHDSNMSGCHSSYSGFPAFSFASGGSVGAVFGGTASLNNMVLAHSYTFPALRGSVIDAEERAMTATFLTIVESCEPGGASRPFITSGLANGLMLIRDLTIDAPGCGQVDELMNGSLQIIRCDTPQTFACAPGALCTMSDAPISTPVCRCPPDDPRGALFDWEPSPDARSDKLAPFTTGCVRPSGLRANWWRLSAESEDFRECVAFWRPGEETPCAGGDEAGDGACVANRGLGGPLCRVCRKHGSYYEASSASCLDCPLLGGAALLRTVAVVLAVAAVVVLLGVAWQARFRWAGRSAFRNSIVAYLERQALMLPHISIGSVGKAKIVLGYFQVVLVMPAAFDVSLPPEYFQWMGTFEWMSLDWLTFAAPAECFGGFGDRLRLQAFGPLVFLAVLVVGGALGGYLHAVRAAAKAKAAGAEAAGAEAAGTKLAATTDGVLPSCGLHAAGRGAMGTLPFVLVTLFCLVPSISARIFSTYSCEPFGGAPGTTRSFLRADYNIECARALPEGLPTCPSLRGHPVIPSALSMFSARAPVPSDVTRQMWHG